MSVFLRSHAVGIEIAPARCRKKPPATRCWHEMDNLHIRSRAATLGVWVRRQPTCEVRGLQIGLSCP